MANFNKVILMGNLTRDPELRFTTKGTAVARIGLAINRVYTTEAGEKKEEVTYVDVDAFARQAEVIGQYFKKGRPILIEGRLKYDTWEDKQTKQKRSKLSVVLESFQFIDSGTRGSDEAVLSTPPNKPAPGSQPPPATADEPPPPEDDVPF